MTEEQKATCVEQTKQALGIRSNARDKRIETIVESVVAEIKSIHGIELDLSDLSNLMFVVDYSAYRYGSNMDGNGVMPRHLQWRLHNLLIKEMGKNAT